MTILNKFKSLGIAVMAFCFFMGVTLSSCSSKGSENTDTVEAAADGEEHPEGEGDEHSEGEEHPEGEGDEHHEGDDEEHPEGEGDDEEHPEGEEEAK